MPGFDPRAFLALVNMTPAEIRRWHDHPSSSCASDDATRARMVHDHRYLGPNAGRAKKPVASLERLVAKVRRGTTLSSEEKRFARSVQAFVARHRAQGCSPRRAAALANWGSKACGLPTRVPGCDTGLGRQPPADCAPSERIKVQAHTRCKPSRARARAPSGEPLLEREQPKSKLYYELEAKAIAEEAAKKAKKAKAEKRRQRSRVPAELRPINVADARRSAEELVNVLDYPPTERDIRARDFPADPCTEEQYEDWKGNYDKSQASYLKPLAWSVKIATCLRQQWCSQKGPCDDDAADDTDFDPRRFSDADEDLDYYGRFVDGIGRCGPKRKRPAKGSKRKRPAKGSRKPATRKRR